MTTCDYHVYCDTISGIGTGSGVGTKILEIMKDEFPEIYR